VTHLEHVDFKLKTGYYPVLIYRQLYLQYLDRSKQPGVHRNLLDLKIDINSILLSLVTDLQFTHPSPISTACPLTVNGIRKAQHLADWPEGHV
jgi:hypothetical protein